jgi:acetylornithine deacetylase/succinyl-diaminopimelate desuccinylase-like protein
MDDELVSTLLAVYEKQTGLKGHEQIIGGGTFGRLLKRGVAFGAMFPGDIDTMRKPMNLFQSMSYYVRRQFMLKQFMN